MDPVALLLQLQRRGLVAQTTGIEELTERLKQPVTFYLGLDPTADSLHVGHLTPLLLMRHLTDAGHRPLIVIGGGTALVGDPTGKSEARPMLTPEAIAKNAAALAVQVRQVLGPHGGTLLVKNNLDHLGALNYIDFLREVGRHFSVNRMLSAESVQQRLKTSLSFIEFNYQLLQAYDFLVLADDFGCTLQIGGDDQWGNMLAGVDLCRRARGSHVAAMTVPLLVTASGQKMGKTLAGAAWLAAERLTPDGFYQFWVNCEDGDVDRFLRIYTLLPLSELDALSLVDAESLKHAKHVLAFEATQLIHGESAAKTAHAAAQAAFGAGALPADFLPASTIPRDNRHSLDAMPTLHISREQLAEGLPVAALLVTLGWAKSNNEARRLISQGGVRIDDVLIDDPQASVAMAWLTQPSGALLRAGKRRVHRLLGPTVG